MKLSVFEQKIYDLLQETAVNIGVELVKIKFSRGNRNVLDISVDRLDGESVSIKDCRTASHNFSGILDLEEDLFPENYSLEVGSAGVERPLVKKDDYKRFAGKIVILKLHNLYNQSKRIQGELLGIEGELVKIKDKDIHVIEFENIKSANLVFTDSMFRDALSKNKK